MDDFTTQSIVSDSNIIALDQGKTFAFVNGLGGAGFGDPSSGLPDNPWWASVLFNKWGALFCTFNHKRIETEPIATSKI